MKKFFLFFVIVVMMLFAVACKSKAKCSSCGSTNVVIRKDAVGEKSGQCRDCGRIAPLKGNGTF